MLRIGKQELKLVDRHFPFTKAPHTEVSSLDRLRRFAPSGFSVEIRVSKRSDKKGRNSIIRLPLIRSVEKISKINTKMTAIEAEIDKTDCFNGLDWKRPVNASVNAPRANC